MHSHDKNIFKQNKPVLNMNKRVNNFFPRNRRGQELSTNTIIMVILGIIVLVILVLGFTIGWDRFLPFIRSNNIDQVKSACSIACSTNNQYDYCSLSRTLKADDLPTENGEQLKQKAGTCNFFATESDYANYGIEACSSIDCSQ